MIMITVEIVRGNMKDTDLMIETTEIMIVPETSIEMNVVVVTEMMTVIVLEKIKETTMIEITRLLTRSIVRKKSHGKEISNRLRRFNKSSIHLKTARTSILEIKYY